MIYLGNKKGGYLSLPPEPNSKYNGIFWADNQYLYKTLENICLENSQEIDCIQQYLSGAKRVRKGGTEESFQYQSDSLFYKKTDDSITEITLDVKQGYDNREFGRYYEISEEDGKILVTFTKKNEAREESGQEYSFFIVIDLFSEPFKMIKQWTPKTYALDEGREGNRKKRYVFSALKTKAKKILFTFGTNKKKVLEESEFQVNKRWSTVQGEYTAAEYAKNALENLRSQMYGRTGILAGHPWFFQYWTRDEAISARGLHLIGKTKEAKQILLNAIENISKDGRIPNRIPSADLHCADGVGWTFLRLEELFSEGKLTNNEKKTVTEKLILSLERIEKNLIVNGLITNERLETWMDTEYGNDDRSGKRIEIQALTLAMYRFFFALTKDTQIQKKLQNMKSAVREAFWNGEYLNDGKDDKTIRPNIFLAYYIYPELLTKKQWKTCFDNALKQLWLPWGGLATIATSNPLFCSTHTGQNNRSYHRGDSWYFINNIAAICFYRLNKKYIQYGEQITIASCKDLMSLGARGCCSEISSAKRQTSEGCFNQAWSNATLIELLYETK